MDGNPPDSSAKLPDFAEESIPVQYGGSRFTATATRLIRDNLKMDCPGRTISIIMGFVGS